MLSAGSAREKRRRGTRRWIVAAWLRGLGGPLAFVAFAAVALASRAARAQSTIRDPGAHPPYSVELEPHLALGVTDPPGVGSGSGFGAGVRASIELVHTGFVGSINDSVAIGFGGDLLHYDGNGAIQSGTCKRFVPGPSGTNVCVEVSQSGGRSNYVFLPVALQWNFWLGRRGSVFVEPGLALYWLDGASLGVTPTLAFGGRLQLTDKIGLTLRLGYPTISIGVSFFL
jgi:hypothetical protein